MESPEPRRHFFDLKIPLGTLLTFYGLLLIAYGLFGPPQIYQKSLGINVNRDWGIMMVIVGGIFLLIAYRGKKKKN